ncbi:hypothetical protein PSY76_23825, partial [Shigella flexneri]|nr:hypothetical protein [Shigella flexneri]
MKSALVSCALISGCKEENKTHVSTEECINSMDTWVLFSSLQPEI